MGRMEYNICKYTYHVKQIEKKKPQTLNGQSQACICKHFFLITTIRSHLKNTAGKGSGRELCISVALSMPTKQ